MFSQQFRQSEPGFKAWEVARITEPVADPLPVNMQLPGRTFCRPSCWPAQFPIYALSFIAPKRTSRSAQQVGIAFQKIFASPVAAGGTP